MKFNPLSCLSVAILSGCAALSANADDYLHNQCNTTPFPSDNSLTFTINVPLGDFTVPRDVPVGTVFNDPFAQFYGAIPNESHHIACNRNGPDPQPVWVANVEAITPLVPGTWPNIAGREVTGKVLDSGIPGVGIVVELESPYFSHITGQFTPIGGSRVMPFVAENREQAGSGPGGYWGFAGRIALIKTGPIAPGVHQIPYLPIFKGNFTGVPNAYIVWFRGSVRQAECSLDLTDPVSDVPVQLGSWSSNDFSGPGSSTTAVPFNINLLNCEDDPNGSVATAHIKLDGADGSAIIDKDLGLFSLDSNATATGVGIQILQDDGLTAIGLGEDVPIARIVPGPTMRLNMRARYYQLGGAPVGGGSATGALNFTVSYL